MTLSLFWIAVHLASLASPKKLRYLPWIGVAVFPGLLVIDALTVLFWKNSVRFMVNRLDEEGSFDLAGQLAVAGVSQSATQVALACLLFALVSCGLTLAAWHLSKRARWRGLKPKGVLGVLVLAWVALAGERAAGFAWKSRKALQGEHHQYHVHLTPWKPDLGVISLAVEWKPARVPELVGDSTKRPDIYFIMIESTRADAIAPKHAPFLSQFRDEECQKLGVTWAASNATHLSWYAIFNGQLPLYWNDDVDRARAGEEMAPSSMIQLLGKMDYRMEVRAVCDLAYNGMSSTIFGVPRFPDLVKEAVVGSEFEKLTIPEREMVNFEEVKAGLMNGGDGGNFHFIALDSPHFNYQWDESFDPPYGEYDEPAVFKAYPSDEDVSRVKNRYLNAVSFVDSQIADFVDTLKAAGRYEDALIIVTGDHGEEFYEHGSWFHCSSLEAEQTSVPLLIKWPEGMKGPEQVSASHLDILPTLLDYFGEEAAAYGHLPGRSLLEVPEDEPTVITLTSLCGIAGVPMKWRRGGYEASFLWASAWNNEFPEVIHLDDLEGPEGYFDFREKEEWEAALWKYFPDVKARIFDSVRRGQ